MRWQQQHVQNMTGNDLIMTAGNSPNAKTPTTHIINNAYDQARTTLKTSVLLVAYARAHAVCPLVLPRSRLVRAGNTRLPELPVTAH